MSIPSGTRLGPYEVLAPLGAGGMGEVYRARDERLDRDVALKVLPDGFARDPERLARFEREAKLLASLNHPHIAAIYGLEEAHGQRFLVLELVEGETLAERVARGSLPVEETLEVCRQVAEALGAAHERGVIHRDLKPANVKVTPEGKVKVLDFGLAKALAGETKGSDPGQSPTLSDVASREGIILGTAAYMSPEQARGKVVDKRADIWAFGCVLYELLSGARTFGAETVSDTLAASLTRDPNWALVPPNTPPTIHRLLRRCLQKDPKRRLHDIADARLEIEEALAGPASALGLAAPAALPRPARWQQALPWAVAGLSVMVAVVLAWLWLRPGQEAGPPVMRLSLSLPADAPVVAGVLPSLAVSPDGTKLAYVASHEGTTQLYLRSLDRTEGTPLAGTEGAHSPFFSPDGQWVGFFAGDKLKKVPIQGGLPVSLCDAGQSRGASWADDGTIIFSPHIASGLMRVSATGGQPEVLTTPDAEKNERTHRWPEVLPRAKAVVFVIGDWSGTEYYLDAQIAVQSLQSSERKILPVRGTFPRYLPSGHLLFASEGGVFAAPFDVTKLEVTGPSIPVLQTVAQQFSNGVAHFTVSRSGSLIYAPGGSQQSESTLVWYDRRGTAQPLRGTAQPVRTGQFLDSNLSPDGRRVALTVGSARTREVWILDLARDSLMRLTFGDEFKVAPLWTPDGRRIVYGSQGAKGWRLLWKLADGSGPEEELGRSDEIPRPGSWSSDGKLLTYWLFDPLTRGHIWVLPLDAERKPRPFKLTKFMELDPQISPDGRWLAYVSNESGRLEVYVEAFPGPGGKWQISKQVAGEARPGAIARWAPNGRELFFQSGNRLMSVAVETQPTFSAGAPRQLFEVRGTALFVGTADGQRFLFQEATEELLSVSQLNVILNWSEELRHRVPTAK